MVEDEWKYKLEGITSFKMSTILHDTLQHNDIMQEGYRPKMLLYALDELFHIYDHRGWVEKSCVPDAMPLVNLNDTWLLEHLAWAVYNGVLHVGNHPELPGEHQWCTMLAGIFQHIYKGRGETAHCLPYTLASLDCQQRTDMVCEECRQNTTHGRHDDGHGARGQGSRSSSRCCSKTSSQKGWTRFTCNSPPNTPPSKYPV